MVNAFTAKCYRSLVMPCPQILMLLGTLMYNNDILWCVCRRQQKPEDDEEVVIKDQEVDFAEVHSPVKSYASDDGPDDRI